MTAAAERDEWGPLPTPRRGWRWREHDRTDLFLGQHAQQLRAEDVAMGYATETKAYFAEHGGVERPILLRHLRDERRREAEHGRDQPLIHGTAKAHAVCRQADGRRCAECRAYQRWRVARNRAARRGQLCTGTRSSYDAGCRCPRCTAANSAGCARWRERARASAS